jgi:hypothetical protein
MPSETCERVLRRRTGQRPKKEADRRLRRSAVEFISAHRITGCGGMDEAIRPALALTPQGGPNWRMLSENRSHLNHMISTFHAMTSPCEKKWLSPEGPPWATRIHYWVR